MSSEDKQADWYKLDRCPGCGGTRLRDLGQLAGESYAFGNRVVPYPEDGVRVFECHECLLVFKETLPTPEFLVEVISEQAGNVWNEDYDFGREKQLIFQFQDQPAFDVLDIGPSNGALLKALSAVPGRRSGLDVVEHPGLQERLNGEFIHGLLDQADLEWSRSPYDVVTMYDVVEHLYSPELAFQNLTRLLKAGGLAVVETGNAHCYWTNRFGIRQWWYACRFEHHVFWSPESMAWYAGKYGLEVVYNRPVKSKTWNTKSIQFRLTQLSAFFGWLLLPGLYKKYARSRGKHGSALPGTSFMKDHFVTVMRQHGETGAGQ